jgi:hypothetical protein
MKAFWAEPRVHQQWSKGYFTDPTGLGQRLDASGVFLGLAAPIYAAQRFWYFVKTKSRDFTSVWQP